MMVKSRRGCDSNTGSEGTLYRDNVGRRLIFDSEALPSLELGLFSWDLRILAFFI